MNRAEKRILRLVKGGFLSIDSEGRLWRNWRIVAPRGKRKLMRVDPPRRAEMRGGPYYQFTISLRPLSIEPACHALVHRLVWANLHGDIPSGMEINHKDGNKLNNHPDNLELTTPAENNKHARDTGLYRHLVGEATGVAKVTGEQVRQIRILRKTQGVSSTQLAKRFGLSLRQTQTILSGKQWKHIQIGTLGTAKNGI